MKVLRPNNYIVLAIILLACGVGTGTTAQANVCTEEINRIAHSLAALGPSADEGRRAISHRQPTPSSVTKARHKELTKYRSDQRYLRRARQANEEGDTKGCLKAVRQLRKS